jgi:hypothetical protein
MHVLVCLCFFGVIRTVASCNHELTNLTAEAPSTAARVSVSGEMFHVLRASLGAVDDVRRGAVSAINASAGLVGSVAGVRIVAVSLLVSENCRAGSGIRAVGAGVLDVSEVANASASFLDRGYLRLPGKPLQMVLRGVARSVEAVGNTVVAAGDITERGARGSGAVEGVYSWMCIHLMCACSFLAAALMLS